MSGPPEDCWPAQAREGAGHDSRGPGDRALAAIRLQPSDPVDVVSPAPEALAARVSLYVLRVDGGSPALVEGGAMRLDSHRALERRHLPQDRGPASTPVEHALAALELVPQLAPERPCPEIHRTRQTLRAEDLGPADHRLPGAAWPGGRFLPHLVAPLAGDGLEHLEIGGPVGLVRLPGVDLDQPSRSGEAVPRAAKRADRGGVDRPGLHEVGLHVLASDAALIASDGPPILEAPVEVVGSTDSESGCRAVEDGRPVRRYERRIRR